MGTGVYATAAVLFRAGGSGGQLRSGCVEAAPVSSWAVEALPLARSYAVPILRRSHCGGCARRIPDHQSNHTPPSQPHRNSMAKRIGLLLLRLVCLWIWRMKGFRWYASSLTGLIELPTFAAMFVAGMSVTGDWL